MHHIDVEVFHIPSCDQEFFLKIWTQFETCFVQHSCFKEFFLAIFDMKGPHTVYVMLEG